MYSVSTDSRLLVLFHTTKLWTLYGRYNYCYTLVSPCFTCECVCAMCSSIYNVHEMREAKLHLSLIYSALPTVGFRQSFAWRESQKSIQRWGQKNPASRMFDHREINTKRCHRFPAHQRDCCARLWRLWCTSPKEQNDIQEAAIHSACLISVGQSSWAVSANRMQVEKKLSVSLTFAGSVSSGSACPEAIVMEVL